MKKDQKEEKMNTEHLFMMKGQDNTYYNQEVIANFNPISSAVEINSPYLHESLQQAPYLLPIKPRFNQDKLYYTPSFVQPLFDLDNKECLEKHNEKIQKYSQIPHQSILVPKPKSRRYCGVCDDSYKDYFEHVKQTRHRKKERYCQYTKKILKLCKKFKKAHTLRKNDELEMKAETPQNVSTKESRYTKQNKVRRTNPRIKH